MDGAEEKSTQKQVRFAEVLEQRILQGDYEIRRLPTEEGLAQELGIARQTVRRVLLRLVDKGLLLRKPHGRVEINRESPRLAGRLRLAFLSPAYSSADFDTWRYAVLRAAEKIDGMVRTVNFVHWNDPIIPQTLSGFDAVFLLPSSEPIPAAMLHRFSEARNLVVLGGDLSAHGVPSLELARPEHLDLVANHLYELGHRHICCLNTQPHDNVIERRIEQWHLWRSVHRVEGELIDEPVEPYGDHGVKARQVVSRLLEARQFHATALIGLTDFSGICATRALRDHGLQVSGDVSVCVVAAHWLPQHMIPSLTSIRLPDPINYIELCMERLAQKVPWVGPLLMQPSNVSLFIGESTGPVRLPAGNGGIISLGSAKEVPAAAIRNTVGPNGESL